MLSMTTLARRLKAMTAWQKTPVDMYEEEYVQIIKYAVKRLFIDTGRAASYNEDLIREDENGEAVYDADFQPDEEEYIMLLAQIQFFQKVSTDVNNIVGYTTDALTVTNADKPYANLKDTIDKLDKERRIIYYKMARFALL